MHPIRRLCAASACALTLATPPAFAQTPPAAAPASIDRTDDEAAIIASPRWHDLVAHLRDDARRGRVDAAAMLAACHQAIAKPRGVDTSPADACLAAALASFDPDATYYSASDTADRTRASQEPFVGIGLELGNVTPHGPLLVVSPIAGGPGARAGIRAGDLIVRIDGHDTVPLTIKESIAVLRGPADSVALLDIERGASHQPVSISATREQIRVATIRLQASTAKVAALRMNRFDSHTPEDLDVTVGRILRAHATPPDALLLDLRANPGGLLDTMVQLAGAFSTDDTVAAHMVTRNGDNALTAASTKPPRFAFQAGTRDWLAHVRIAVLIDGGTGSGAEALAQFLREQRAARLVGARTFGNGAVDTTLRIGADATIKIRTGDLLSSKSVCWDGVGILPDTLVPASPPGARVPEFGSADDVPFALAMKSLETP